MFYLYPKIYYRINDYDYLRATDILVNVRLRNLVNRYRQTSLRPYVIKDGESPDFISYQVYGTPKYDYIILLTNNIDNFYEQWPKSFKVFNDYIEMKYGTITYAKTNFAKYYTSNGNEISADAWNEQSVSDPMYYKLTYYEYEERLNDAKTQIRLLNPNIVTKFEVELQLAMSDLQKAEA